MIGLPLEAVLARWAPSAEPAALAALVERYKRVYEATVIPRTFLFPFTWSLLRRCRAEGLLLGLATAKSTPVARAVLARCRVTRLFASIVGGDRAERPKPHPDLLRVALGELGVRPGEALLVGDGDHDIEMGRAAGARTCAVTWGVHPAERLRSAGADYVVHSPRELRDELLPRLLGEA
jgi:phosphoglycolate phosphatase